jgi:hypothetical protein
VLSRGDSFLPNVPDEESPLASGMSPAREAESAGDMPEVPEGRGFAPSARYASSFAVPFSDDIHCSVVVEYYIKQIVLIIQGPCNFVLGEEAIKRALSFRCVARPAENDNIELDRCGVTNVQDKVAAFVLRDTEVIQCQIVRASTTNTASTK